MKKYKIALFYNSKNTDIYASIISYPYGNNKIELESYSKIGQHSLMSIEYLKESKPATINKNTFELFKELKKIYNNEAEFLDPKEFLELFE